MPDERFLVVRLGSLGDIVHTFPAVSAIRSSFPSSEIVWLTDKRWKFLVECAQLASAVWTVETRSWRSVRETIRAIRSSDWSAAVDYQGLWKSALLPFLGRVRRRIGFDSHSIREAGVPILYTDRVRATRAHIADQNGELSLRAGASAPVGPVTLQVPATDSRGPDAALQTLGARPYCVLSPGGGWPAKCWPASRFGELCARIRQELDLVCVINYGPGEERLARAVCDSSGGAQPIAWTATLESLMQLLRNARLVVGGDTGPVHLAVALGTRVVGLFGPTEPERNGPYSTRDTALRSPDARTSHVRRDETDPSMLALSVESVFAAVKKRLEAPE